MSVLLRHVLHVLTVPDSLVFLEGQVAFMRERGWTMTVVTSPGAALDAFGQRHGVNVHAVSMPRKVSPTSDAKSLAQLSGFILRTKPDLVHAHTPKGGLLGTIAATIARVKARIYHMRGLPLLTAVSTQRKILTATERTSCSLARIVIANSQSLRDYAIEHRLCSEKKIRVLGSGSGNGVDAAGRFNPEHVPTDARSSFRRELGIPENAPVIGFLGRLVRDKGIIELADAWARIRVAFPDAHLVLGGIFEERDPVPPQTRTLLESDSRVHVLGFVTDTPRFFAAIDVFTLPTYREGFPNVLLEAAAMQCAIVSTKAMGAVDAVVDGTTGTLVPPRDGASLAAALRSYLDDRSTRVLHGTAARARALTEFRRERLWSALADVYDELVL